MKDSNCIFCKIAAGEMPSNKIYEDEETLAFYDVSPHYGAMSSNISAAPDTRDSGSVIPSCSATFVFP